MERTVRYAIGALSGAALLCGIAAAITRSAPVALAAAFVAASAGVVSLVVSYADSHHHQAIPSGAMLPRSLEREASVQVAITPPGLTRESAVPTDTDPGSNPEPVPMPAAARADQTPQSPEIRAPRGSGPVRPLRPAAGGRTATTRRRSTPTLR